MSGLLQIEALSGGYRGLDVLKDVSLQVSQGDFLGLIGPNGSGKTTLLRCAGRVLRPRQGEVRLHGADIYRMDLKRFCRKVACVSQELSGNFPFTVEEIVLMGRIPYLGRLQFESRRDRSIVEDALSLTDASSLRDKFINELSAGECQRVMLARALAQEPELLLLDEPTSHLDIGHQIQIMDLLKRLNRDKQLTIVMVMHDLNLAGAYCRRIALLDNGSIYRQGLPREVLTYRNIEAVYKTIVLVNDNPVTGTPNVVLVPGER